MQSARPITPEHARIVRELHDVVAHSISVLTVQAAAAGAYIDRDPVQAREHLDAIRRTAQDALCEMRRMGGVLREDAAVLVPQPTLARVCELVAEARGAGIDVELVEDGARPELPPGLDLAAFRILQEALANVRRHAGAVEARVRIAYRRDWLDLEVVNVRTGGGPTGPLYGNGIAGMRERARMYGGRLEATPQPDGTFAVRARLPF